MDQPCRDRADDDRARPLPSLLRTEACRRVVPVLLAGGGRRLRARLDALRIAGIDEPTWAALDPPRAAPRGGGTPGDLPAGG